MQAVTFGLFIGDEGLAKQVLGNVGPRRIARHVAPDGSQPLELARTLSHHYTLLNTAGMVRLARLGELVGVDVWNYRTADGRSIRAALDWLIPYATGKKPWEHKQIKKMSWALLVPALRLAASRVQKPGVRADDRATAGRGGGSPADESLLRRRAVPLMTRRALCLSIGAAGLARGSSRLDRFGGWTGMRFESTGFFRLERKERWWLVTPEGNAYLSLGLNHADPGLMLQSYNRSHWLKAFDAEGPRDERFLAGFRKRVMDDVARFGFNSFGCHTQAVRYWKPVPIPYIATFKCVDIDHWRTPRDEDFLDVYAPEFESHCEKRASEAELAQLAKDPFLLGYAFTDCPILTELDAAPRQVVVYGAPRAGVSTWPRVLRNLPESAPGKQAYVRLMKARYGDDIESFNEAYGVAFGGFDALAQAAKWRPVADARCAGEARDNQAFLASILDKYYSVMHGGDPPP